MKSLHLILAGFLFLVTATPSSARGKDYRQEVAEKVLAKLFQSAGQYSYKQPSVAIANDDKKVAAYYPSRHQIILDRKAYNVCRSFGKDSLNALAFIIGHELAHSFHAETRDSKVSTNFLSYDRAYNADIRVEKVADIQGIFTAWLAGYHLKETVPGILNKIYREYGLLDKVLPGYPTLEQRNNSTTEVLAIVSDLIDVFETANYLMVTEHYPLAIASLEYVLGYYQGREVYNNLGVLCLLNAMDFYDHQTDRFVYPVELDGSTQLKKLEKARGGRTLSYPDRLMRDRLLERGIWCFNEALRQDGKYASAKSNLACALVLAGKPAEALDYLQKNKLPNRKKADAGQYEKLQMASAIANAQLNHAMIADAAFFELSKAGNPSVAAMAQYNLDVLNKREIVYVASRSFELPDHFARLAKSIELPRTSQLPALELDAETGIELRKGKQDGSGIFSFWDDKGGIVSIVRFQGKPAQDAGIMEGNGSLDRQFFYNLVTTPDGYFLKSDKAGMVLKVDQKGKVLEMARVFKHRPF